MATVTTQQMDDDLKELAATLRHDAAARGLTVFPEMLDAEPSVPWGGDGVAFLALAQQVGVPLLYMAAPPFVYEQFLLARLAQEGYLDEDAPGDIAPGRAERNAWMHERLMLETARYRSQEGKIGRVVCTWMSGGVAHVFDRSTPWFRALADAATAAFDAARLVTRENRVLLEQEQARRVRAAADQLVCHARFSEASSEAKRRFMAEELFAADPELAVQSRRIAELAQLIYWWDVEPLERVTKADRARELYLEGHNIRSIATTLKMSEAKVRDAIMGAPQPLRRFVRGQGDEPSEDTSDV